MFLPSRNTDELADCISRLDVAIRASQAREATSRTYLTITSLTELRVVSAKFGRSEITYDQSQQEAKIITDKRNEHEQAMKSARTNIDILSKRRDAMEKLFFAVRKSDVHVEKLKELATDYQFVAKSYAEYLSAKKKVIREFSVEEQDLCSGDSPSVPDLFEQLRSLLGPLLDQTNDEKEIVPPVPAPMPSAVASSSSSSSSSAVAPSGKSAATNGSVTVVTDGKSTVTVTPTIVCLGSKVSTYCTNPMCWETHASC